MNKAEYTPEQITAFVNQRTARINDIVRLRTQLADIRDEKYSRDQFNSEINLKYQVTDGLDALSFETIAEIQDGLLATIAKEKRLKESQS